MNELIQVSNHSCLNYFSEGMRLRTVLRGLGGLAILLTFAPFVAVDYWWIRIFDFPHFHLTIFTLCTSLLYLIRFDTRSLSDYIFLSILLSCFAFQMMKIYPYTAFDDLEVFKAQTTNLDAQISIYSANVLQSNSDKTQLTSYLANQDADLLLLMETDQKWARQIKSAVGGKYPFKVEQPLNNTYGLLMYSKYPLLNARVKFRVADSVPSIESLLLLPSNDTVKLHAIHPTPPLPQHNPMSSARDAEMMMVALEARDSEYPVIVFGDFNDVAWSETTRLFQNVSGLLDPRIGRGFFNSYHAENMILRWPLDHLFVSEHFRLLEISRGEKIGSDHFPIFARLSYEPDRALEQEAPAASEEQIQRARDQIEKAFDGNK